MVLMAHYDGVEAGPAIVDILTGRVSPGGKLPVTFPRHVGQLPVYYNRKPTSFRNYNDSTREPLFVFGHGLTDLLASSQEASPADRRAPRGR